MQTMPGIGLTILALKRAVIAQVSQTVSHCRGAHCGCWVQRCDSEF